MRRSGPRALLFAAVAVLAAGTMIALGTSRSSSSHALATTTPGAGGAVAIGDHDWITYHRDAGHSGTASAPPLIPAHAAWTSATLDGEVYGEPLAVDGAVLVATQQDTVYALDPALGTVRWRAHLATPVAQAVLPCGNVDPLGILSTPVVDPGLHRIFVVAEEKTASGVQHELVGLDTRSGAVVTRQVVDPPGMNVVTQQQRSSLVITHGRVIVAFGGLDGDCGKYHGWLVSAAEDAGGSLITYHTPGNGVAFWSSGGPVVDSDGFIYVTSGNGNSTTNYDQGESVLKFTSSLEVVDSFAVADWAADNAADADLGSAGPVLLDGGLLFQAGKHPMGYLIDTAHLGGIAGEAFAGATSCSSFGAQAWSAPDLYVTCIDGPLRKFRVDTTTRTFSPVWTSQGPGDGPPVVGGGAVWTEDWKTGTLLAYDVASGRTVARFPTGPADHFVTPAIVGGEVVVAAKRQVHAFVGPAPLGVGPVVTNVGPTVAP